MNTKILIIIFSFILLFSCKSYNYNDKYKMFINILKVNKKSSDIKINNYHENKIIISQEILNFFLNYNSKIIFKDDNKLLIKLYKDNLINSYYELFIIYNENNYLVFDYYKPTCIFKNINSKEFILLLDDNKFRKNYNKLQFNLEVIIDDKLKQNIDYSIQLNKQNLYIENIQEKLTKYMKIKDISKIEIKNFNLKKAYFLIEQPNKNK